MRSGDKIRFSASMGAIPAEQIVATAQRAEELGYASVTLPDHLDDQAAPLIGLTAAALSTRTLRVLPSYCPMIIEIQFCWRKRSPASTLYPADGLSLGLARVG